MVLETFQRHEKSAKVAQAKVKAEQEAADKRKKEREAAAKAKSESLEPLSEPKVVELTDEEAAKLQEELDKVQFSGGIKKTFYLSQGQ